MSNKTQLQTNNSNLDALITRVNAAKNTAASLPEAGGGSGGVETCTVTIDLLCDDFSAVISRYAFLVYRNGEACLDAHVAFGRNDTVLTVNDVVCGSTFYVAYDNTISVLSYNMCSSGGVEQLSFTNNGHLITANAPTTANGMGRIYIEKKNSGKPDIG